MIVHAKLKRHSLSTEFRIQIETSMILSFEMNPKRVIVTDPLMRLESQVIPCSAPPIVTLYYKSLRKHK